MQLHVHGISDVGRERQQNEDRLHTERLGDGSWLLVVCDGMGGHEAGNVASEVATRRIAGQVAGRLGDPSPARVLWDALVSANDAVREQAALRGVPSMGTTAVVGWVVGGDLWCGWVGDSRLYHYREGELETRTEDHTRVQKMVEMQILSEEEARHHPEAHVLTQALGGGAESQAGFRPSVWGEPSPLLPGDALILCSDGLYDLVPDAEIYPLVADLPVERAVAQLVETANARGGHDNVTVVVASAGEAVLPPAPPADTRQTLIETPSAPVERPAPPDPPGGGSLFAPPSLEPRGPSERPPPAYPGAPPGPPPAGGTRGKAWVWGILGAAAGIGATAAVAVLLFLWWWGQRPPPAPPAPDVTPPPIVELDDDDSADAPAGDDDSAEDPSAGDDDSAGGPPASAPADEENGGAGKKSP